MKKTLFILYCLICMPLTVNAASSFKIKGTLLWHNFLSGPSAWNLEDYESYLDQCQANNFNLIAFHCYSGGLERYCSYVEPAIKVTYRNVIPQATWDTTQTARWGYVPMSTDDFAFSSDKYIKTKNKTFGSSASIKPKTNLQRYHASQSLMREVMQQAHKRDIEFAMGFEFGIYPPEILSAVDPDSWIKGTHLPDPLHPASIEILHNTIDDIIDTYPEIDWIWLWLHEHTAFVAAPTLTGRFAMAYEKQKSCFTGCDTITAFNGIWALEYIKQAHAYIKSKNPDIKIAISGWGGSNQLNNILVGLDKALPKDITFSCLNPGLGTAAQSDVFTQITKNRATIAIPWLEGDHQLWHLQPRVALLKNQIRKAASQNIDGVVAIHWRVKEIQSNIDAFAHFANAPGDDTTTAEFYNSWLQKTTGTKDTEDLAQLLADIDQNKSLWSIWSPEFYPYDTNWGKITPQQKEKINNVLKEILKLNMLSAKNNDYLIWLRLKCEFILLLDQVSRKITPAYELKQKTLVENYKPTKNEIAHASKSFRDAPIEKLFKTYCKSVTDRTEMGVLCSLNQKLYNCCLDLDKFLTEQKNME